jgi:hypothetical protein
MGRPAIYSSSSLPLLDDVVVVVVAVRRLAACAFGRFESWKNMQYYGFDTPLLRHTLLGVGASRESKVKTTPSPFAPGHTLTCLTVKCSNCGDISIRPVTVFRKYCNSLR